MIIAGIALIVFVLFVAGIVAARRVQGDASNYILAGRQLSVPIVSILLVSQAIDSNATLGNADLAAEFGFWAGVALPLGLASCLVLMGLFFARRMHALEVSTLPEFFARRFGRRVEVAASVLTVGSFGMLLAGNLVACGFLMKTYLGVDYTLGLLIVLPVILAYTVAGGMFASANTGVVQVGVSVVGVVALAVWMGMTHGFVLPEGKGPFDPGQLAGTDTALLNWATIFALAFGNLVAIDLMQRIFSARSGAGAQRACFAGAALLLALCVPLAFIALAGSAALQATGNLTAAEPGLPLLFVLLQTTPEWLAILVLAGLVSATLTTVSGVLLSTSTVIAQNILRIGLASPAATLTATATATEQTRQGRRQLRAIRLAMLPMALFGALVAVRIPQTGILLPLAFDLLLASLVVPFVFGLYWRHGGAAAALASIVAGIAVRFGLFVLTPTIYGVENTLLYLPTGWLGGLDLDGWATFIGAGVSLVTYLAVAFATSRIARPIPQGRLAARQAA